LLATLNSGLNTTAGSLNNNLLLQYLCLISLDAEAGNQLVFETVKNDTNLV